MQFDDHCHTVTDDYILFWGGPFSQWAPSEFTIDNLKFNCAEQYMMYHKAFVFLNLELAEEIMATTSPKEQKALGRKVYGFDAFHWNRVCFKIVVEASVAKFTQNEDYKQVLLDSGNRIIVEASPFDKIWGIGLSENDNRCKNPGLWKGQNLLGLALMVARNKINK